MAVHEGTQDLAAILRKRRLGLGLSQEEVSHRSGIDQKALSSIERGQADPRLTTIVRLASALELELTLMPVMTRDAASGDSI